MEPNILHIKLFLDSRNNGIVQPNGGLSTVHSGDFYINIPLTRTYKKFDDYINVEKDKSKSIILRQNFNPYFIELSFFETIKAISNTGDTFVSVSNPQESVEQKAKLFNITLNKF